MKPVLALLALACASCVTPLEVQRAAFEQQLLNLEVGNALIVLDIIEGKEAEGRAAHASAVSARRSMGKLEQRVQALEDRSSLSLFLEAVSRPDVNPAASAPEDDDVMLGEPLVLDGVWATGGT